MTITINEELQAYAEELANADNVTLDVWCERKINGLLKRQLKDSLIEKINTSGLDQVNIFKVAVESAKKGITAGEIENEAKKAVVEEDTKEEEPKEEEEEIK